MSYKHYNIAYLEETGRMMKDLKFHSYAPFNGIQEGVVADIGCGTGMDIIAMAQSPAGMPLKKFIGVDHDPGMIEQARASAGALSNVEFLCAEASSLPFGEDTLSGVRAERLFQHIDQPDVVFGEIRRVLKADHPFVVVETDWSSFSFYNADQESAKSIRDYFTGKKVRNGLAARKLTSDLLRSGFREVRLEVCPLITYSYAQACAYIWLDKIIGEMQEQGLLASSGNNAFLQQLKDADAGGHFACSLNMVISYCIK